MGYTSNHGETDRGSNTGKRMKGKPFAISTPFVMTLSLFGLMFTNCCDMNRTGLGKVYAIVVLTLLYFEFLRGFSLYAADESFGTSLFSKVVGQLLAFLGCVAATTTIKACAGQNHFSKFLVRWSRLIEMRSSSDRSYNNRMKRKIYAFLTLGWISYVLFYGIFAYCIFNTTLMDYMLYPVDPNGKLVIWAECGLLVINVFKLAAVVFVVPFFFFLCAVIYVEFEVFCADFRKAISPDGDIDDLEYHRRRHQEICRLVETADRILCGFNAAGIVLSTFCAMLILYNMLWSTDVPAGDTVVLLGNFFWLMSCLLFLVMIAYGGGYLNHMAHSPLADVHDIRLKSVSPEFSLQMTMFLTKLTGESIGLTAMGMFVIDKPTILTIAGVFVTYFIVLVQFQQPLRPEQLQNCTNLMEH